MNEDMSENSGLDAARQDALAEEYLVLLADMDKVQISKEKDKNITAALAELEEANSHLLAANQKVARLREPYEGELATFGARMQLIHKAFLDLYDGSKDVHMKGLTAKYRVTRTLKIHDKAKAVAVLVANDKTTPGTIANGIGTFALKFMRSLKEVGFLDDETASYTEKVNVNLYPVEEKGE